jgi:hypothetical protein
MGCERPFRVDKRCEHNEPYNGYILIYPFPPDKLSGTTESNWQEGSATSSTSALITRKSLLLRLSYICLLAYLRCSGTRVRCWSTDECATTFQRVGGSSVIIIAAKPYCTCVRPDEDRCFDRHVKFASGRRECKLLKKIKWRTVRTENNETH